MTEACKKYVTLIFTAAIAAGVCATSASADTDVSSIPDILKVSEIPEMNIKYDLSDIPDMNVTVTNRVNSPVNAAGPLDINDIPDMANVSYGNEKTDVTNIPDMPIITTLGASVTAPSNMTPVSDAEYVPSADELVIEFSGSRSLNTAAKETSDTPDAPVNETTDTPDNDEADKETSDIPGKTETEDTPDTADEPLTETDSPFKNAPVVFKRKFFGDIDSDGVITSFDAFSALRMPFFPQSTPVELELADVDFDGIVTSADALEILRCSDELNSALSVEIDKKISVKWFADKDGNIYAEKEDGTKPEGVFNVEGFICVFGENGLLLKGSAEVDVEGKSVKLTEEGILVNGWVEAENGYTLYDNGTAAEGWVESYGQKFYLNNNVTVKGWQDIDGKHCYFGVNGAAANGFANIDGKTYYFNAELDQQKGFVLIGNSHYMLYEDGGFATGWTEIDGNNYYFCDNGAAAKGWQEIDGDDYYFIDETTLATGLEKIGSRLFAFSEDGKTLLGWESFDGDRYYFTEDGAAVGSYNIGEEKYFFNEDGTFETGFIKTENGTIYKNEYGFIQKGFKTISDLVYHFADDGIMSTGTQNIDGSEYIFDENGVMTKGWHTIKGLKAYLIDSKNATGEVDIDGEKYFFEDDGTIHTGFFNKGSDLYYKTKNGFNVTGWQEIDGNKYYFGDDGKAAVGLTTIGNDQYYFGDDAKMLTDTKVGQYRVTEDGKCFKLTTVNSATIKYVADDIIAQVGSNASSLLSYVMGHVGYVYVSEPMVYSNPYAADWGAIAAFAYNRGYGACYHFAALMDVLLQRAGYTTRLVVGTGFYTSLHCYNQVYVNGEWLTYDGVHGLNGVSLSYIASCGYTMNHFVNPTY